MNRLLMGLVVVTTLVASACLGPRARSEFFPLALGVWQEEVSTDFERGLADGVDDGDLDQDGAEALRLTGNRLTDALVSGDRVELLTVPYEVIDPWVSRGILDRVADGEIGTLGAQSRVEQANNFKVLLSELGVRVPATTVLEGN